MRLRRLYPIIGLALLFTGLLICSPVIAQQAAVIDKLIATAQGGDTSAQFELAQIYGLGDGVERDPERAREWMIRAAENGHLEAQAGLGVYFTGEGQAQAQRERGIAWLHKAAERRHALAAIQLGLMAVDAGEGVQALRWFRIAADSGDQSLQLAFSDMLQKGEGVPLDLSEAYYWAVVGSRGERVEAEVHTALGNQLGAKSVAELRAWAEAWQAKPPDSESAATGYFDPLTGPLPTSGLAAIVLDSDAAAAGFFEVTFWDQREEGDERPPIARRVRYQLVDATAYRAHRTADTSTVLEVSIAPIDRRAVSAELREGERSGASIGLTLDLDDDGSVRAGLIAHGEGYHEIAPELVAARLSMTGDSVTGSFSTTSPQSETDWRNYRFAVRVNATLVAPAQAKAKAKAKD